MTALDRKEQNERAARFVRGLLELAGEAVRVERLYGAELSRSFEPVQWRPILAEIAEYASTRRTAPTLDILRTLVSDRDQLAYENRFKPLLDDVETCTAQTEELRFAIEECGRSLGAAMVRDVLANPAFQEAMERSDTRGMLDPLKGLCRTLESTQGQGDRDAELVVERSRKVKDRLEEAELKVRYWNLLEPGEVHLMAGASSAGKSSLAVWWAAHWANGEAFDRRLDRVRSPENGFALYLGMDPTEDEILKKFARFQDVQLTETTNSETFDAWHDEQPMAMHRVFLFCKNEETWERLDQYRADRAGVERLIQLVESLKDRVGDRGVEEPWGLEGNTFTRQVPPQPLVIVDSLTRFLPEKANELDNRAMTRAIDCLHVVAARTGAAVLVLGHISQEAHAAKWPPNPLTYLRGGTGQAAAARVNMALMPVSDTDKRVLGLVSVSNNYPTGDPLLFEVRASDDPIGTVRYFKLLDPDDLPGIQAETRSRTKPKLDRSKLLSTLTSAVSQGRRLNKALVREVLAKATNRSKDNQAVREEAGQLIEDWLSDGTLKKGEKFRGHPTYEVNDQS